MKKINLIKDKTCQFALNVIQLYVKLRDQKEFILSKQLLRSGTSIGANVEEATAAQSGKDFLAKMSIASNEARETHYWWRLFRDSGICVGIDSSNLIKESDEIIRILTAIVKMSQENLK